MGGAVDTAVQPRVVRTDEPLTAAQADPSGLCRVGCLESESVKCPQDRIAGVATPLFLDGVACRSVSIGKKRYGLVSLLSDIESAESTSGLSQLHSQRCKPHSR